MAKVDTIELSINGKEYKYNINVGKEGLFRCKLDWDVAKVLGVKPSDLEAFKLDELRRNILNRYHDYLEANKSEELLIAIRYASNGEFAYRENGHALFGPSSEYRQTGSWSDIDSLCFDFDVYIRETSSTGVVIWYETKKGQGCVNFKEESLNDPNTYYRSRQTYGVKGKVIPFSEKALETLTKAREGMRRISTILYDVISQEEKELIAILHQGKLLNAPERP